ncbi:hypothetical protein [Poritiphilus flavus]|uniref:hypothetical protein n=1 Tax=Poritiphilus flavus TaxID=2697053 RepID=UPI00137363E2|nr:hypothetical protein [Poritiphilus flavus]
MRTILSLCILFCFYGHAQHDPLVGKWQRLGHYTHECDTDKHLDTNTGAARLMEEFRADGTWEVIGAPWRGTWHRLKLNEYRFTYDILSKVETCRVEFRGNELRLYNTTCDSIQAGDKKLYGYLLLIRTNPEG